MRPQFLRQSPQISLSLRQPVIGDSTRKQLAAARREHRTAKQVHTPTRGVTRLARHTRMIMSFCQRHPAVLNRISPRVWGAAEAPLHLQALSATHIQPRLIKTDRSGGGGDMTVTCMDS